MYHVCLNGKVEPATEANRLQVLPTWASNYRENLLGLMPFTRCHFFAVMDVGDEVDEENDDGKGALGVLEVLFDRTVADKHSIERLGLKIDKEECSSYWGIAAMPVQFYGKVTGPVPIRFSHDVVICLPEIKVIDTNDVLFIIGDDFMASG